MFEFYNWSVQDARLWDGAIITQSLFHAQTSMMDTKAYSIKIWKIIEKPIKVGKPTFPELKVAQSEVNLGSCWVLDLWWAMLSTLKKKNFIVTLNYSFGIAMPNMDIWLKEMIDNNIDSEDFFWGNEWIKKGLQLWILKETTYGDAIDYFIENEIDPITIDGYKEQCIELKNQLEEIEKIDYKVIQIQDITKARIFTVNGADLYWKRPRIKKKKEVEKKKLFGWLWWTPQIPV